MAMIAVIAVLGVALIALVVGLTRPPSNQADPQPSVAYQNEGYTAPPPDLNPPELPAPQSEEEAWSLLKDNALYQQTVPRPIRCELSAVDASQASEAELQTHLDQLTACLMKEWAQALEAAGYIAVRPTVTIYSDTVQTACGKHESRNAFYCGADQQVYWATDLVEIMPPRVAASRIFPSVVMAHEFGHAIQARTGIVISNGVLQSTMSKSDALVLNRRLELQADCFSGLFIGSIADSYQITAAEYEDITQALTSIGDDVLSGEPDIEGNHGRSTSRVYWGEFGIKATPPLVGSCNTWVAPEDQVR